MLYSPFNLLLIIHTLQSKDYNYGPPGGRPVLLVPSLDNRAHTLDLAEGSSLARYLAGRGLSGSRRVQQTR